MRSFKHSGPVNLFTKNSHLKKLYFILDAIRSKMWLKSYQFVEHAIAPFTQAYIEND